MNLQAALGVLRGVTAVIGSGGKTTLMRELARELAAGGATVTLATSTRILPFDDLPTLTAADEPRITETLAEHSVVCVGEPAENGKLCSPAIDFERLTLVADHILVEADGSKRLPLKAHAAWEPVVPECADRTILVLGAGGFGRPIAQAVHRPEIFCRLAGCAPTDIATPELVARVIGAEALADTVVVNQAEATEARAASRRLANILDAPVFAGSIRAHDLEAL